MSDDEKNGGTNGHDHGAPTMMQPDPNQFAVVSRAELDWLQRRMTQMHVLICYLLRDTGRERIAIRDLERIEAEQRDLDVRPQDAIDGAPPSHFIVSVGQPQGKADPSWALPPIPTVVPKA